MPATNAARPFAGKTSERIATALVNLRALAQDTEPIIGVVRREAMRLSENTLFVTPKDATADASANASANNLEALVREKSRIKGITTSSLGAINQHLAALGVLCTEFQLRQTLLPKTEARLTAAIEAYVASEMHSGSFAGV